MSAKQESFNFLLDKLINDACLLGQTQSKRYFGCYGTADAIFERTLHEIICKHANGLREKFEQISQKQ